MTDRVMWVQIENPTEQELQHAQEVLAEKFEDSDIRVLISGDQFELLDRDALEALLEDALYAVRDIDDE